MTDQAALAVETVTRERLGDLASLFGTNATTSHCYCTWFILSAAECKAGWYDGGNRTAFEARAAQESTPMGLLAYIDGQPVAWCAAGPRSRYERALRSNVLREHDPAEDDAVWLVPCFFVRTGFRRQGLMHALLDHAVDLAATHGATAVEGFPVSSDPGPGKRRSSGDLYVGAEPVFAACGFAVVSRPTPSRVVMRRELTSQRSRSRPRKRQPLSEE